MKWFRESILGLSIGCMSAAASAQEPTCPPVSLGKSTPLADSAIRPATYLADETPRPIVNAFVPIRQPAPCVVRGARAILEEEPGDVFLPKDLAPGPARKVPSTTPAMPPRSVGQPMPIKNGLDYFRVDKNVTINVADEPETLLPTIVNSSTGPIQPVRYSDERIIMTDAQGNPLFRDASAQRWYGQLDWLLWWTKGSHQPPLVTTAPVTDPIDNRGALGFGSTGVLFGDANTSSGPRSGGRFTVGHVLDDCGIFSLEVTGFFLGTKNDSFNANSAQFPVLVRPFFDVNLSQQQGEFVTTPELPVTGSIQVNSSSRLWGMEANARALLWCGCQYQISGLAGFRYLDLYEDLSVTERILVNEPIPGDVNRVPLNPGDRITVFDQFAARNRFYGGQIGINTEWQRDRWSFDARVKVALGANCQSVDIDGRQSITSTNGKVQGFPNGGFLALASNSGHHSQTRFGVVPEVGFKVGYQLTDNVRLFAGYDFLYWSNVLRASDQIDLALDANKVPNSGTPIPSANINRPVVPFLASGFWAQGVSVGMEIRY